ncbi:MAG: hypothetical protein HYS89_01135 [Candidatus Colwellbacteria bacterium]|nr:hypothetical protein [Candidatus Colwellbacteria bacterium]
MALALGNPGNDSVEPTRLDPVEVGTKALELLKKSKLYKRARKQQATRIEAAFRAFREWLVDIRIGSLAVPADQVIELLADNFSRLVRFRLARAGYGNRQAKEATWQRWLDSSDELVSKGFDERALLQLTKEVASLFEGVQEG